MNERVPITELAKADIQKEDVYTRPLSIEEKTTIAETIAGVAGDEIKLSEEMKEQRAVWKERAKELSTERKSLLRQKRTGQVEESGRTFTFLRMEERMAYTFNANGVMVGSRRMRAEEFQMAIPQDEPGVVRMAANGNI